MNESEMLAFWQSRLDEDERTAEGARHGLSGEWTTDGSYPVSVANAPEYADVFTEAVVFDEGSPSEEQAEHIAKQDPARTLRETQAARKRLAALSDAIEAGHDSYDLASALLPYELLPYADHPDYQEGWRP